MDGQITLCVLAYGDYPQLLHRCLNSIWDRLQRGRPYLQDIRLGLNEISPATRKVVDWFVENATGHYGLRVITYDCPQNACKYPLMRRMLLLDPEHPAEWVMWFDDDSYLVGDAGWWERFQAATRTADMLGKPYTYPLLDNQWKWIQAQPWFNPQAGLPPRSRVHGNKPAFRFATGGWWAIRSEVLAAHDWPIPALRHCGGDTMLGELLRHRKLRLGTFYKDVKINAAFEQADQTSPRRGVGEVHLGRRLDAPLPDHNFECIRTVYGGNHDE